MRILVTGGTGFTGKALCQRLIQQGHEVVSLDYKEGVKTDELRQAGARVVIGSVTDRKVVDECMAGVHTVHHLAAAFRELNVPNEYYREVNAGGTRVVFESAQRHGVRTCIYCSTCGVHGNVRNPPAAEDAPIAPADYYQQTKYEGEEVAQAFFGQGMKVAVVRPAAIYGPGDPERFYMIFRYVAKGYFPMFGSGRTTYHPLYIDNLVDAFLLAAESDRSDRQTYLIADEHYWPIEEIVKRAAAAVGAPIRIYHLPVMPVVIAGHICEKACKPFRITPPLFPRRVDWFRQNRAFSIDKARRELGYRPAVDLDEGLRRTGEWYAAEGYLTFKRQEG